MPVATDVALFTVRNLERRPELSVVLIKRNAPPHEGQWALPGGFVREGEDLDAAAKRVARGETAVVEDLEQVGAVGTVERDPRFRVLTVVYMALIPSDRHALRAREGAAGEAAWFPVSKDLRLAFDHNKLLELALDHLRHRLPESEACFRLLPEHFTLGELQRLCETVLGLEDGQKLDRVNFRQQLQKAREGKREFVFLEPISQTKPGGHQLPPAQLYRFMPDAFQQYVAERHRRLF
jgi:8-oxo-dGTP diphosphatase